MSGPDDELVVELREGDCTRKVPVASLAAVLRLPSATIRTALARLLFESFDRDLAGDPAVAREPTEGVGDERSETNVPDGSQPDNSPKRERDDGERGGSGEGGAAPLDANRLAVVLDDHANRAALAVLVAHHPEARLRAALTITLARPASSIRVTRGAYFTGVLKALAAREATPPSFHARTDHPAD